MSEAEHEALDALVARARMARPPLQTQLEARRAIRLAVEAAEHDTRARRRRLLWLSAACAALALLALWSARPGRHGTLIEVAEAGRPLRVALTSGDTVVARAGSKLELLSQESAHRELSLLAGGALFEVRKLAREERFEVRTRHARIAVRGTVFSVEVVGGRTVVRVYEGRVQVAERSLGAGQVWISGGPAVVFEADPLLREGRAAAAQRTPDLVVSALPDVTPGTSADGGSARVRVPGLPETSLAEARAWLLAGDSERALLAALASDRAEQPGWLLLEADALRALRRHGEAVDAYRQVAERAPSLRASAGYEGASLAFHALQDAGRALSMLDALALDDPGSPLRERSSVLRVDVLLALGRRHEAKLAARRYLEREPETQVSERMRALAHGSDW